MNKIALVVEMQVRPERREAFIEIMRGHAMNCLTLEDGCLHFDVAVKRDDPNCLVLYEVYRDQAALDAHAASAHLAETQKHYPAMLNDRRRVEVEVF